MRMRTFVKGAYSGGEEVYDTSRGYERGPFLFEQYIFATNPKFFETLNWNETGWKKAKYDITVDFNVDNTGSKNYYEKRKLGR